MPLVGAIGAGNRVMIKPSEYTPRLAKLLKSVLGEIFSQDELYVAVGGVKIAKEFSSLPFDHLLFTGSTNVGRIVAGAASKNLTPVTLELGGKSTLLSLMRAPIMNWLWRALLMASLLTQGRPA